MRGLLAAMWGGTILPAVANVGDVIANEIEEVKNFSAMANFAMILKWVACELQMSCCDWGFWGGKVRYLSTGYLRM